MLTIYGPKLADEDGDERDPKTTIYRRFSGPIN